ncbi:hypothetical protein BDR03DRAFT_1004697 [Suillus americanus]|nr:hypothetical protein BDR03DRAFT_1004697 [Suillus americanus]
MSAEYLQQAYDDFALAGGTCRIIHATAGASTGLDIQGVMIVIQYGIPKNMSEAAQRGGRAVRDENLCGLYLIMVESLLQSPHFFSHHHYGHHYGCTSTLPFHLATSSCLLPLTLNLILFP